MRSIKFRSWNGREFGYFQNGKYDELFEWNEVQQFAGLTDKNGVEVYEGDIMGLPGSDMFFVVKYNLNKFVLDGCVTLDEPAYFYEREVIGNIYEHSHLCRSCNSKKHNHIYENPELLGDGGYLSL